MLVSLLELSLEQPALWVSTVQKQLQPSSHSHARQAHMEIPQGTRLSTRSLMRLIPALLCIQDAFLANQSSTAPTWVWVAIQQESIGLSSLAKMGISVMEVTRRKLETSSAHPTTTVLQEKRFLAQLASSSQFPELRALMSVLIALQERSVQMDRAECLTALKATTVMQESTMMQTLQRLLVLVSHNALSETIALRVHSNL